MPRQSTLVYQHAFNRGELHPGLWGRKDWQPVYHGLRNARNVIVVTGGAVLKCPGTKFCGEALEQQARCRLIDFYFSDSQSYVLEFGEKRFRIWYRGEMVVYPEGHEEAGQPVIIDSPFTLEQMQSTDLNINIGDRSADYAQENDTMIIVHPSAPPMILTRYSHSDWRWSTFGDQASMPTPYRLAITVDGGNDVRYRVSAIGEVGESYASDPVATQDVEGDGNTTLTWDVVNSATSYRVYREYEVPNPAAGQAAFEWRLAGTVTENTFQDTKDNAGDRSVKPLTETNPFNRPGRYPSVVVFDRNRLVMGGTNDNPNRLYGSRLGNFHDFVLPDIAEDPTDEDPYQWDISGAGIFTNLVSGEYLFLLSSTGERLAKGERPAINLDPKFQSNFGSAAVKPVHYRGSILFAGKDRRSIGSFSLDPLTGNYGSKELSHFSSHIFEATRIVSMAAKQSPYKNFLACLDNGRLAVVTYMADEDVIGVTRRTTDGMFEAVCSVDSMGTTDVYVQTVRQINGVAKRYIEIFREPLLLRTDDDDNDLEDESEGIDSAWYVDCGLEYRGDPRKVISGLGHLEGKAVVVNADGYGFGYSGDEIIVRNGSITLPMPASHVIVGIGYEAEVRTIDMAPQGTDAECRNRHPVMATATFLHSRDCLVSCETSREKIVQFIDPAGAQTKPKRSDAKTFMIPPAPMGSTSSSLTLRSRSPFPWGISRIDMTMQVSSQHNLRD